MKKKKEENKKKNNNKTLLANTTEPVSVIQGRPYLSTWRPPRGPLSFAPMMAASSRIDRGHGTPVKNISFWLLFRLTFPWSDLAGQMPNAESTDRSK